VTCVRIRIVATALAAVAVAQNVPHANLENPQSLNFYSYPGAGASQPGGGGL